MLPVTSARRSDVNVAFKWQDQLQQQLLRENAGSAFPSLKSGHDLHAIEQGGALRRTVWEGG